MTDTAHRRWWDYFLHPFRTQRQLDMELADLLREDSIDHLATEHGYLDEAQIRRNAGGLSLSQFHRAEHLRTGTQADFRRRHHRTAVSPAFKPPDGGTVGPGVEEPPVVISDWARTDGRHIDNVPIVGERL